MFVLIIEYAYRKGMPVFQFRACTGFDGGLEVGEAIRSGTLR